MKLRRAPEMAVALLVAGGTLLLALVSASGTSAVGFGAGWIPEYDLVPEGPPNEPKENVGEMPVLVTATASVGLIMIILVGLLLFGLGLVVLIGALRRQVLQRRRRRRAAQHGDELEPEGEFSVQASDLVSRAARGALTELRARAGGVPADAVVVAWVVLEGAAAKAGSARQAHQTPTEFTAAVLAEHAVDTAALHRLRRLYQRARFGTATTLTKADVAAAEADLETLVGGLTGSAGGLTGSVGGLTGSAGGLTGSVGGLTGSVGDLPASRW
jgi:hypothetical protein